jgi:hypothetical protein
MLLDPYLSTWCSGAQATGRAEYYSLRNVLSSAAWFYKRNVPHSRLENRGTLVQAALPQVSCMFPSWWYRLFWESEAKLS